MAASIKQYNMCYQNNKVLKNHQNSDYSKTLPTKNKSYISYLQVYKETESSELEPNWKNHHLFS